MTAYIALLRGINVGGFTLPMAELRSLCQQAGFLNVRTYIQSGNVLFVSDKSEDSLRTSLEALLQAHKSKHIPVIIRNLTAMEAALKANPFPKAVPSRVGILFLQQKVPKDLMQAIVPPGGEEIVAGEKEIYIHYPNGMGPSKLKFPKAIAAGTMRNMNTVSKLVQLSK